MAAPFTVVVEVQRPYQHKDRARSTAKIKLRHHHDDLELIRHSSSGRKSP